MTSTFKKHRKTSKDSEGKGQMAVVKMKVENESVSIYWERGNAAVLKNIHVYICEL